MQDSNTFLLLKHPFGCWSCVDLRRTRMETGRKITALRTVHSNGFSGGDFAPPLANAAARCGQIQPIGRREDTREPGNWTRVLVAQGL